MQILQSKPYLCYRTVEPSLLADHQHTWTLRRLLSLPWENDAETKKRRISGTPRATADGGVAHATSSSLMQ